MAPESQTTTQVISKCIRELRPAPPTPKVVYTTRTCFYDLPAELRVEIYKIVLERVVIHILPSNAVQHQRLPHPLARTSRQIRNEVLPVVHSTCTIRAVVTDFNFAGLLVWMARIPPDDHRYLIKNRDLSIRLHTTLNPPQNLFTLRKWLHDRADPCRPQPHWLYCGPQPSSKVANDLKRRVKRMKEPGKQAELKRMVKCIKVDVDGPIRADADV